ncbi:galactose mutarotase [Clostridium polyendosporum]|uniref:Galactose mutarotase n=1 Tax=Clostridium polyendosporum TaxID=69208 RepID=A0A919VG69_9CLOT|nr:aldose 1-epimerase family protein [Clostridium polyendosporum]GIM28291.1 galactose mutarotase [Clostridium polyendosporum]
MLKTLENNLLKITASTFGGELHSIKGKKTNTEFLWDGNETYWKYHAPILFPIVGKVYDNKYIINNKTFELPQHGLARTSEFNLFEQTENSLTFELKHSKVTLEKYPFKFSLQIKYTLEDSSVKIEYIVNNLDNTDIYFSIGAHPAFKCPILENENFQDYYFEFSEKETASTMELTSDGYFSGKKIPLLKEENIIGLTTELFKNDALVFNSLKSHTITLKSKNHSKNVTFDFNEFPYLGLWSKPSGAPFVCIEPWFGHADYDDFRGEFKNKEGIISLEINKSFKCTYTITVNE